MIERRNGTIKDKRPNKDLLEMAFKIDQRSFWDIMGYIASYLEKVNYYDLQNKFNADANWKSLVEGDSIIYMVLIINESLSDLDNITNSISEAKTVDPDNQQTAETLINWYNKITQWHDTLVDQGEFRLANKIKNVLTDVLEGPKNNLLLYQQKTQQTNQKSHPSHGGLIQSPPTPPAPTGDLNFSKTTHTFEKVIMHIQQFTKDYLEQNICTDNTHMPNNALYIAFALLYKNIQKNLNTLSKRHLDFYYKEVLQQRINKGKATQTIVNFELLPAIQYSLIEKGTQLTAGKLFGSKTDVLFQTEKPLVAYQMELMELQTLFFNSSSYIQVGTDEPTVSSVSMHNLITQGKSVEPVEKWFAFGANKQTLQKTQINSSEVAILGFIIGSPVLFLSEGKREIKIQVNMNTESASKTFWKLLNQIKSNRKIGMDLVFLSVFNHSLRVSYTTKKGWVDFKNYSVEYDESENYFAIHLLLENSDPELELGVQIQEELKWPSVKVELNEYAPVYLYSFWKGLEVDTIDIDVNVQRIRNLSLYNNIGKMSPGKSFDIFGPFPNVGSYLMVGKSEFFKKRMNTLSINLEWDSLPDDFDGFESYYEGYSEDINNDSFNVQVTALSNNYWLPTDLKKAPIINLFSTHTSLTPEGYKSVQLNDISTIQLSEFNEFGATQDFELKDPLKYEVSTQSGFIKLSLVTPKYGFGNDLYQKEYVEIATHNAKNPKSQIPYPNKPFVPKLKGVSVDYTASDSLVFNEELSKNSISAEGSGEFIHITPFGVEEVIINQNVLKRTLVCNYEQEGYLFLGLKGIKNNTTISVFFHLLQSSTGVKINRNSLTWEYFQTNRWVEFEEGNIISDETGGFVKSGIIEFLLPKVEGVGQKDHQKLYWIRISTIDKAAFYPKIKGIYLNAVKATCISQDETIIGKEVPANSIKKIAGNSSDIKKVNQPVTSHGGVLGESEDQFYQNVSERIRHKSRAVTLWDHERLILENFNDVRVVKCTNFDQDFKSVPGQVKLIVLSNAWSNDERHYFDVDRLDQMKMFLQKHSSSFADIKVVNPKVEYLLANCVVEFKPEDNGGYYLNLLNENISDFLSPMSSIDNGLGGIGGSVMPTMLMSFLENLYYVQSIKKLTIEHIVREGVDKYSLNVYKGGEEIKTTTPWSILSPVKKHHIISVVNKSKDDDSLDVGVGDMEIGLDFIVGSNINYTTAMESLIPATSGAQETKTGNDAILVFKNK